MTFIILLHALFASSFPISKVLLRYTSPIFLTGARMTIAGVILLSYQYFWPTAKFRFKRKHIKWYVQIIVLGIYVTYILRFWGLSYLPAGKTAFFYNFSPFFVSLYAYFIFGERITRKQLVGLVLGFLGMIPIIISTTPMEKHLGEMFFVSWPELALLISVALHSYSWIIIQRLVRDKSYDPGMVNGITMTSGGILALLTSFFVDGLFPVTDIAAFAGWLAIIICISNIICHNLYGYLLKRYTATFLAFAGFLSPMFACLYGWAFLNERITWHFWATGTIVFIGLYVFYQDELGRQKFSPQEPV